MDPRHKRFLTGILLLAFAIGVFTVGSAAQTRIAPVVPVKITVKPKKQFIVLTGAGIPVSRESFTKFWKVGPSWSLNFFVNVSSPTALGIGADVSLMYFKVGEFSSTFPGVPVQKRDVIMTHVYVGVKHSTAPTKGFAPYFIATLGAARVTGAVYKEIIDSVRVTYYDIPGRTRLAGSVGVGTDIALARWLAFTMEVKATYFHNDPDVGFSCLLRGGFRFTL